MSALTTRDTLKRELQRHIGAHADIVANALLASGVVIDAATLADDETLIERLLVSQWSEDERAEHPQFKRFRMRTALETVAAHLTERGAQ